MMKANKLILTIGFIIINFGVQSFNFGKLSFCDFYTYHPECSSVFDVVLNKTIRLILNLVILALIINQNLFRLNSLNKLAGFIVGLLFIADLFIFFQANSSQFIVIHKVLNPLLYSPLIAIALGAFTLFNKSNST
jgi:hypothetical protein